MPIRSPAARASSGVKPEREVMPPMVKVPAGGSWCGHAGGIRSQRVLLPGYNRRFVAPLVSVVRVAVGAVRPATPRRVAVGVLVAKDGNA